MLRVALRSALYNKRRLFGTGSSVVIGIAFLAGTFVFTDTIKHTFDTLFANGYANTDAYVRSSNEIDIGFGQKLYDRMPDSVADTIRGIEGVDEVLPDVTGFARIIGANGKPVGMENGAPTGATSVTASKMIPWKPVGASVFPHGPDEVMLNAGAAKRGKLKLGDKVTIISQGGSRVFTLVGVARFGNVDSPAGATIAMFDLATAQSFIGKPGKLDDVFVSALPGVTERQLADRLQQGLGRDVSVLTGAEILKENQTAIENGLSYFNILLLVFAGIALFVGSFIIYNTFSIIVAQKQRENALLRAIGASRQQIVFSVLVESVIVGFIASAIGIVAGIGVSSVLKWFMARFGIDIPAGGIVLLPRTAFVSFFVGVVMTIVAAVSPALRASRIAPVAAMRDVAIDRSASSKGRLAWSVALSFIGALMIAFGLAGNVKLLAGGVPILFIGVFVMGPLIARPVAKAIACRCLGLSV